MALNNCEIIAETWSNIFRWRSRCRRCRLCLSSLLWRSQQQRESTTLNFSFSTFTSTELFSVHLQRVLSTTKETRKKQLSQNSHYFPSVYFQVTFSLPMPPQLPLTSPFIERNLTGPFRGQGTSLGHRDGMGPMLKIHSWHKIHWK